MRARQNKSSDNAKKREENHCGDSGNDPMNFCCDHLPRNRQMNESEFAVGDRLGKFIDFQPPIFAAATSQRTLGRMGKIPAQIARQVLGAMGNDTSLIVFDIYICDRTVRAILRDRGIANLGFAGNHCGREHVIKPEHHHLSATVHFSLDDMTRKAENDRTSGADE